MRSSYWQSFESKYGFEEGSAVPPDAAEVREVECKIFNTFLEKHGSNYRVGPFDRAGFHNWVLVFYMHKDDYKGLEPNYSDELLEKDTPEFVQVMKTEPAFIAAQTEWQESDWNAQDFVHTKVRIDNKELSKFLKDIKES